MKTHKFKCLTFFVCLFLLLFLSSCSGFNENEVKSSGAVNFSFDARSLLSSLEDNNLSSDGLQGVKVQIALLGDYTTDPQTLTFTEAEIKSEDKLQKSIDFAEIPEGASVYASGIIYAILKEEAATFVYPVFYGSSEPITIEAGANKLTLKLTSMVKLQKEADWEVHGSTSDGKLQFMLLTFKGGTYILTEAVSGTRSIGNYQNTSSDENGKPSEFRLTERVYWSSDLSDYMIVKEPQAKTISVSDGKFSFTSASGFEIAFQDIVVVTPEEDDPDKPVDPNNPDDPDTPESPEEPDNPENPEEPEVPDNPETPQVQYPYEIKFFVKNDGTSGTADTDYTCLTELTITGNFTLAEDEQAFEIINGLAGTEIQQKLLMLQDSGYILNDDEKPVSVNNFTDGKVVINYYFRPTYPGSGSFIIKSSAKKYTLVKNEDACEKFYLNRGSFAFSLLDEDGNDALADVKWDATDASGLFINQNLLNVKCYLTYKGRSLNILAYDGVNHVQLDTDKLFTKAGSYLLTLTVSPSVSKTTYVNKSGQTVDFPDFEPVSGTFEIEVEDYLYTELDLTGIESTGISAALSNALSDLTTASSTVYFKLCGQTSEYYTDIFSSIKSAISNASSLFFIDASDLTTSYTSKDIQSCAMQSCSKIQGLILPDDMDHIGGYAFTGCTNLETVVFGKGLKDMSTSFDSCAKLSSVTFPAVSSFESFGNMSFSNCPVLKTLKLPASIKGISSNAFYDSGIEEFTLEDTSGTWYFTFDSETYWAWMGGTLEPPSRTENAAEGSSGLVTDLQTVTPSYSNQDPYTFPDGTSLIQKLTWLAKQTSNTGATFTKSIYLYRKTE